MEASVRESGKQSYGSARNATGFLATRQQLQCRSQQREQVLRDSALPDKLSRRHSSGYQVHLSSAKHLSTLMWSRVLFRFALVATIWFALFAELGGNAVASVERPVPFFFIGRKRGTRTSREGSCSSSGLSQTALRT
jgi:hypothetical protein